MTLEAEFLEHIEYKFLAKVNDSQEILLRCNFWIMLESGILQEVSLINMVSIHSFSRDIIKKKIKSGTDKMLEKFRKFQEKGIWIVEISPNIEIPYHAKKPLEIYWVGDGSN